MYEEKYEGWRMLAVKEAGAYGLSAGTAEITPSGSSDAKALAALKLKTFTLDGEVAVFDAELISRSKWLRHINHPVPRDSSAVYEFDLLLFGDQDYQLELLKVWSAP